MFTGLAQLVEHWSPKPGEMAGIVTYVKESFEELKNNVTWTPWSEAQRLTVVVAVFSILFSLAIWGIDTVFSRVIKAYFGLIN